MLDVQGEATGELISIVKSLGLIVDTRPEARAGAAYAPSMDSPGRAAGAGFRIYRGRGDLVMRSFRALTRTAVGSFGAF
jgi:hypothetical protein